MNERYAKISGSGLVQFSRMVFIGSSIRDGHGGFPGRMHVSTSTNISIQEQSDLTNMLIRLMLYLAPSVSIGSDMQCCQWSILNGCIKQRRKHVVM